MSSVSEQEISAEPDQGRGEGQPGNAGLLLGTGQGHSGDEGGEPVGKWVYGGA